MDNSQVLQHHADLETNERVEELREQNRRQRSSANKDGLIAWLKSLGISYGVMVVLSFFSLGATDGGLAMSIIMFVGMGCVALVGPLLPVVNFIRYKRKLNDEIASIDSSISDDADQFKTNSTISSISLALIIPALICTLLLVMNPISIFQYLHYGWIIGIVSTLVVFSVIFSIGSFYSYSPYYYTQSNNVKIGKLIRGKSILTLAITFISIVLFIVSFVSIPNKTYHISTAQHFNVLANSPSAGKCSYVLDNDIDFEGKSTKGWGSIKEFSGTFDGNHHTIKNLNYVGDMKKDQSRVYMSGMVCKNSGTIKNIKYENCTLFAEGGYSRDNTNYMATIAAINDGEIINCIVKNVYLKEKSYTHSLAGVVASNSGTISNVIFYVDGEIAKEFYKDDSPHYLAYNSSAGLSNAKDCLVIGKNISVSSSESNRIIYLETKNDTFELNEEYLQNGWEYSEEGFPTPCNGFNYQLQD